MMVRGVGGWWVMREDCERCERMVRDEGGWCEV